jgi:hypothetical protein
MPGRRGKKDAVKVSFLRPGEKRRLRKEAWQRAALVGRNQSQLSSSNSTIETGKNHKRRVLKSLRQRHG